ncbi:hypothetical protein OQA88_12909 [Cercophora sp. LCS_1]
MWWWWSASALSCRTIGPPSEALSTPSGSGIKGCSQVRYESLSSISTKRSSPSGLNPRITNNLFILPTAIAIATTNSDMTLQPTTSPARSPSPISPTTIPPPPTSQVESRSPSYFALKPTPSDPRPPLHIQTPASPFSPLPTPRSGLEDLNAERAYLTENLHRQGERTSRLYERYAALEPKLSNTPTRKVRKEASMLKNKISESTRQEQGIMLRLGEIWLETQNRERLVHARHVIGVGTPLGEEYYSARSVLSPLTPEFVPAGAGTGTQRGVRFDEGIWEGEQGSREDSDVMGDVAEVVLGHELEQGEEEEEGDDDEKAREGEGDKLIGDDEEYEDDDSDDRTGKVVFHDVLWEFDFEEEKAAQSAASSSSTKRGRRSISLQAPFSLRARDKRMSLPSLKTIWPRSYSLVEGEEEDDSF